MYGYRVMVVPSWQTPALVDIANINSRSFLLSFLSLVLVLHKYDGIYLQYLLCISIVIVTVTKAWAQQYSISLNRHPVSRGAQKCIVEIRPAVGPMAGKIPIGLL